MKKNCSYLKDNQFCKLIDNLFIKIENNLNIYNNNIDIDYIIENYVFKIIFLNKSIIVINRHIELKQIWLATNINGYRFQYQNNKWICNRSNQNFWKIFHDACCAQSNVDLPYI